MRKLILTFLALLVAAEAFTATGTAVPFIKPQYFDANGDPCNGCQLFVYTSGTSTKTTTYSDAGLLSQNANPVVLDSAGRASIFLVPGTSVKLVLASSTDTDPPAAPYWSVDGIQAVPPASTSADVDVSGTAGENLSAGDVVYLSDGSGGGTAGRWYLGDADNTYSSTTAQAIGFANAAITTGSTGTIRRIGRVTGLSALVAGTTYYISATAGALTAVAPTNVRAVAIADTTTTVVVLPGHAIASATVPGIVGLLSQTLGSGATTDVKTVGAVAVNSTPNYKPGGDSALDALASGVLTPSIDTTQHANSGTGLTDLSSYSLPANVLSSNGKAIRCTAWGTTAANGNTKSLFFKFGGTSSSLASGGLNAETWIIEAIIIRTGAATQKMIARSTLRNGAGDIVNRSSAPAETLSGAVTIKTQGQSGTASSDILQEGFFCEAIG